MQFTAHQISLLLGGTVEGDPNVTVNQLAKIEEATTGAPGASGASYVAIRCLQVPCGCLIGAWSVSPDTPRP